MAPAVTLQIQQVACHVLRRPRVPATLTRAGLRQTAHSWRSPSVRTYDKPVEHLTGTGTLLRGGTVLCNVPYRLTVYQTFRHASLDAPPTPGLRHVQGHLALSADMRRGEIEGHDLTLHLDDGRRLNLRVGRDGRIYTRELFHTAWPP